MLHAIHQQDDLLTAALQPTCPAVSSEMPVPAEILKLDELFLAEIQLRNEISAMAAAFMGQLEQVVSYVGNSRIDVEIDRLILERYLDWSKVIVVKHLSTPLSPFKIESEWLDCLRNQFSVAYRYGRSEGNDELVAALKGHSPIKVWEALIVHYDPNAQAQAQSAKNANTIAVQFGLRNHWGREPQRNMKLVKGRVEAIQRIYSSSNWNNSARSLNGCEDVRHLALALRGAMADTEGHDNDDFTYALERLASEYAGKRELVSRERHDLGSGVEVVTCYNDFKYYIPQHIAQRINLFLAESGALEEEE